MRILALVSLPAGAATLAGCATVAPVSTASSVCGGYGYVDVNNDGFISGSEWNTYRTTTYSYWDTNADGRISRSEFENCYRAGGSTARLITTPITGPITGPRSIPMATAISATTNIGRPAPGPAPTATATAA